MFTAEHFTWLGLCAVFVGGMCVLSLVKRFSQKAAGYVMTGICLFSELSKIMYDMEASAGGGMHLDPKSLPFHLCSQMIFAVLFITFGKEGKAKQLVINFISVMGTLGSLMAMLIPTNGTDFLAFPAYQCFVYHAGLMWFSLYLILSKKADLGLKSLRNNLLFLSCLVILVLYINSALSMYDTNFFFLTRPPMKNLPYLNLSHGWYVYFIHIAALGTLLISLFQLPFIIKERKAVH